MPTAAEIIAYFRLDPETGKVYVRNPRTYQWRTRAVGKLEEDGYIRIKYKGKWISAAKIVWVLHTDDWPKHTIDHENRIRTDNRPSNLRDVTHYVNNNNKPKDVDWTTGYPGISYHHSGRYRVAKKRKYLGSFLSLEAARAVYDAYEPVE